MINFSEPIYRLRNTLHTFLLLAGMIFLAGSIGWLIAGAVGVVWSLIIGMILTVTAPRLTPRLILYLYNATRLPYQQSSKLAEVITWLTANSHIAENPKLYYIPSSAMLAFTVGMNKDKSIAISDGLLRELNIRELTAVLAHEISHIKSNDLWILSVADIISQLTRAMALIAYLMIILYFPLYVIEEIKIPYLLIILLILAPTASALMQLALSRTREFNADMQAIKLTGDPDGLISALIKIEHYDKSLLKKLFLPSFRTSGPSLLRTHPDTDERIERLRLISK